MILPKKQRTPGRVFGDPRPRVLATIPHYRKGRDVIMTHPPTNSYQVLDLFAGPGGWDEGARLVGIEGIVGLELDPDACATAVAAGFARVQCDIREADPAPYAGIIGLIASPPCQTFTDAGKGEGQGSLEDLGRALVLVGDGMPVADAVVAVGLDAADPRSALILEPMRFTRALKPRWIAFEEVCQALPVWETYGDILRRLGYSVWTGILNAANYGVPQSRKRAFLMASLDGTVQPPIPTHAAEADWGLFDERQPWVTMADALGWGPEECRAANLLAPAPARNPDRALWPLHRPATTVVRSFRPDVIATPGYRQAGDGPRQNQPGSIGVSPEQMCVLQGIRTDYPFIAKGATKRLSLIGAVVPPPWASAILAPLVAMSASACVECGNDDPCAGWHLCSDCLEAA
jgi:DNA (cytosine-5)-methyltransferase 1